MSKSTSIGSQKPILFFFQLPEDELKNEGIASALQSFETSVMLVGYYRWPSIIQLLWGACEALLRARYPYMKDDKIYKVQNKFHSDGKASDALNNSATKLRKLRNDISHRGYMPRDTPICVELFFNAGIPYFDKLLNDVTGYSLSRALYPKDGIWEVFSNTRKVVTKKANKSQSKIEDALIFFSGAVQDYFSPIYIPDALLNIQDTANEAVWASETENRNELIGKIENQNEFDVCYELAGISCPVCGCDVLSSVLLGEEKGEGYQYEGIESVGCYKCGYLINDEDLIKIFFLEQLTEDKILELESGNPPIAKHVWL